MKRVLFTLVITLLCNILHAQSPYYFYNHEGKKVYLSLNTEHIFLSLKEQELPVDIQQRSIKATELKSDEADHKKYRAKTGTRRFWSKLSLEETMSEKQYLNLLSDIKRKNKNAIISPYFNDEYNNIIGLSRPAEFAIRQ